MPSVLSCQTLSNDASQASHEIWTQVMRLTELKQAAEAKNSFSVQDSKFFQMFDVDGDGLISYTEYLLLITFLSIPVEVSNADCMLP